MKFLRAVLGYMIAGMFVMAVWGKMASDPSFGIFGGWFAALSIIGIMWFMNHFLGMIHHDADSSFVDQGLGIALTGIFRDVFMKDGVNTLVSSLPTLGLVAVGAVIGGVLAYLVEKDMAGAK
ncbi:MAG: hypothetical protein WBL80_08185 [Erysipelotrichaceae bacterium]